MEKKKKVVEELTYLGVDCDEKAGTGEEVGGVEEGLVKPKENGELERALGPESFPNPKYDILLILLL